MTKLSHFACRCRNRQLLLSHRQHVCPETLQGGGQGGHGRDGEGHQGRVPHHSGRDRLDGRKDQGQSEGTLQ